MAVMMVVEAPTAVGLCSAIHPAIHATHNQRAARTQASRSKVTYTTTG